MSIASFDSEIPMASGHDGLQQQAETNLSLLKRIKTLSLDDTNKDRTSRPNICGESESKFPQPQPETTEKLKAESASTSSSDIDLICEKLYLGNMSAATDVEVLRKYNVHYILTIYSRPLPPQITMLPEIEETKFIQLLDMPNEDILSHFDETYQFIENETNDQGSNGSVLVHCYQGVSRSATIVLAYMMKKFQISLDEALATLKARRPSVGPNSGFLLQLKLYEHIGYRIDKNNLYYKRFQLDIAAEKFKSDVVKVDPAFSTLSPDAARYQCRKCRRILASASNLLVHYVKQTPLWSDFEEDLSNDRPICTQMIFLEPLAWMKNVVNNLEGKLFCANENCQAKLGSFSWKGCACPCGANVKPAFYLIPSKIDRTVQLRH